MGVADSITTGNFMELPAATQRTEVEEWVHNPGGEIHESKPADVAGTAKSGGIPNDSFGFTYVSQTDFAFYIYLFQNRLTLKTYELRPKNAAQSATNFSFTGSAVVNLTSTTFGQGALVRGSGILGCDGPPTIATS